MSIHRKAYFALFNQITDTLRTLEDECEKLKTAQRAVEEYIIINDDGVITQEEFEAKNTELLGL